MEPDSKTSILSMTVSLVRAILGTGDSRRQVWMDRSFEPVAGLVHEISCSNINKVFVASGSI